MAKTQDENKNPSGKAPDFTSDHQPEFEYSKEQKKIDGQTRKWAIIIGFSIVLFLTVPIILDKVANGFRVKPDSIIARYAGQYPTGKMYSYILHKGFQAVDENRLDTAEKHFKRVLKYYPDDKSAHKGMMIVFFKKNNPEKARHHLEINVKNGDLSALNRLGMLYHKQGRYKIARKHFERAVKINPRYAPALDNLGYVHYYLGDHNKAMEYFNNAIEADPNFADSYCGKGMILVRRNEDDLALVQFNKAVVLDPRHADAHFERGIIYTDRQQFDNAEKDFTKALQQRPGWMNPLMERALVYYVTGRFDKALKDYRSALKSKKKFRYNKHDEVDPKGHLLIMSGLCLYQVEKKNDALPRLKEGLKILQNEPPGRFNLDARAYVLALLGRWDQLEKFLKSDKEILHRRLASAMLYKHKGKNKKAASELKKIIKTHPGGWERQRAERMLKAISD